jgi:hypothetical protein
MVLKNNYSTPLDEKQAIFANPGQNLSAFLIVFKRDQALFVPPAFSVSGEPGGQ